MHSMTTRKDKSPPKKELTPALKKPQTKETSKQKRTDEENESDGASKSPDSSPEKPPEKKFRKLPANCVVICTANELLEELDKNKKGKPKDKGHDGDSSDEI